ncbi:hypothetical protein [Streptomyces somaliensis]|uniref:hypothetical protein n=1 Tax=Streptomyces somaliensis TaxID=78355 RepID=UPI00029A4670|nr:hypothetical protein [Streptomyces somaliensis]
MDRLAEAAVPYHEWFTPSDGRLVLFTTRPAEAFSSVETARYLEMHHYSTEDALTLLERDALRRAGQPDVTAVVAPARMDLLLAAVLRERRDLPGQTRRSALLFNDVCALRHELEAAGLPTVNCSPVTQILDVFGFAAEHGFPVRVRPRGARHGATVELGSTGEVEAYVAGGLTARKEHLPDLAVESVPQGRRMDLAGTTGGGIPVTTGGGIPVTPQGGPVADEEVAGLVAAALDVLSVPAGHHWQAKLIRTPEGVLIDELTVGLTAGDPVPAPRIREAQP